jgi:hypothetical protein
MVAPAEVPSLLAQLAVAMVALVGIRGLLLWQVAGKGAPE